LPEATSTSVETGSPHATRALAREIGRRLTGGECLAVRGPLGAGKTTFAKGVAEGLGIDPRDVTSPTFLLVHELVGRLRLVHVDAYRVRSADELRELGVEELREEGSVLLVEWPERVPGLLPEDRLDVEISPGGREEARRFRISATGARHETLAAGLSGGDR
jgi:tRNA threonylcarbamoyladenosine biosynthesis protein TsaE